jgi:hypothetical protein
LNKLANNPAAITRIHRPAGCTAHQHSPATRESVAR